MEKQKRFILTEEIAPSGVSFKEVFFNYKNIKKVKRLARYGWTPGVRLRFSCLRLSGTA